VIVVVDSRALNFDEALDHVLEGVGQYVVEHLLHSLPVSRNYIVELLEVREGGLEFDADASSLVPLKLNYFLDGRPHVETLDSWRKLVAPQLREIEDVVHVEEEEVRGSVLGRAYLLEVFRESAEPLHHSLV